MVLRWGLGWREEGRGWFKVVKGRNWVVGCWVCIGCLELVGKIYEGKERSECGKVGI